MFKKIVTLFRRDIPYGIRNLLVWFKVIWNDRNWDYHYIFVILRHKLNLMEKAIRNNNNHTEAERDADQIKECVEILDRLINDVYFDLAYEEYHKKWGEIDFKVRDGRLELNNSNVQTPEDHEEERHDFKNATMKEHVMKENDIHKLFALMRNNIQGWWD